MPHIQDGFQISVAHLIASGLSDPLQGSPILRELAKRSDASAHIQVNEFANRVCYFHPSSDLVFIPTTDQASDIHESPREAKFLFDPPLHFGCLEWHNFFGRRRRRRRSAKPYIWKWPKCEYPGSGGRLKIQVKLINWSCVNVATTAP